MFISGIDFLLSEAKEKNKTIGQIVADIEADDTGVSVETIYEKVLATYQVMKNAVKAGVSSDVQSVSGLSGGDAKKYNGYVANGSSILSPLQAKAMAYSLATSEYNASMGVIVAAPTAGAAGILPGVLIAAQEELDFDDHKAVEAMLTASGIGTVIAIRATISGAEGGCQAECGAGMAMAAAALTFVLGGTPETCANSATLALKNCLGLVCDPVAGLVEVPCVKRNGIFAAMAIVATDLSMSGVKSFIPPDEVIDAMYQIGTSIPPSLRETAKGGLAVTDTGLEATKRLYGEKNH